MVYRSMENDLRVADELYIMTDCLVLEDWLLFSLYSFCCIAKQVRTLKQLPFVFFHNSFDINFEHILCCFRYHIIVTNVTCTRSHPLH